MPEQRPARSALWGALVYLLAGLTWILVGDYLLLRPVLVATENWWMQPVKGALFVLVTALMLYVLLRRTLERYARLRREADNAVDHMQLVIEGSRAAVWSYRHDPKQTDLRAGDLFISAEMKALIGLGPDDPLDGLEAWLALIHPEDVETTLTAWNECITGERDDFQASYRIRHRDGSWRWLNVRGRPARESSGNEARWTGMVWDITELREADERNLLFSSLFENARDALLLVDDARWIVRVNKTVCEMLDRPASDIEGRTFDAELLLLSEPDLLAQAWNAVTRWGHWSGELAMVAPSGDERRLSTRISVMRHVDDSAARYLVFMSDVTEDAGSRQRLDFLTRFDPLTRLPNAHHFQHMLAEQVDEALDSGLRCALICLDVDRFQAINETLGTGVGDTVLADCAARLRNAAGTRGQASRLYGDTFAVLSPPLFSELEIETWAHGVESAFAAPFMLLGNPVRLTVGAGVAMFPEDGQDAATLQAHAEVAMAQARSRGGARMLRYEAVFSEASASTLRLEGALRDALANGEIECHLQPQIDLQTGEVTGAEALARWCLDGQWIPPIEFVAVAEARGLAPSLGEYMLRKAAAQLLSLQANGLLPDNFRVSVNLSALQVAPELPGVIREVLDEIGLPASRLCLELTESALIEQPEVAGAVLSRLREAGITMSIDDFGTGFSSLTQLQRLPLDFLKLDRAFVRLLPTDAAATAIVRAIIALADAMNLRTIAEGVETLEQYRHLSDLGCYAAQGYLIRPALPAPEFEAWLRDEAPRRIWLAPPL